MTAPRDKQKITEQRESEISGERGLESTNGARTLQTWMISSFLLISNASLVRNIRHRRKRQFAVGEH